VPITVRRHHESSFYFLCSLFPFCSVQFASHLLNFFTRVLWVMEMARPRKTNGLGIQVEDTQICVVMVGLPARGKSLIAQKGMDMA
jgi:hypothetical protein